MKITKITQIIKNIALISIMSLILYNYTETKYCNYKRSRVIDYSIDPLW